MKIKLEIEGDKELARKIKRMSDVALESSLTKAALAGANIIEEEARERAPKRTGRAARSITSEVKSIQPQEVKVDIGPGEEGWYLMFHEFGTSKMAASPFLRPALDEKKQEAVQAAKEKLLEEVIKAVR